jgi:hypothetical protein
MEVNFTIGLMEKIRYKRLILGLDHSSTLVMRKYFIELHKRYNYKITKFISIL